MFTDESRFTLQNESRRLLIWREQFTRYNQYNIVETHSYTSGGITVWAEISSGGYTDLHVLHGATVTGVRYQDEILDQYVHPYATVVGTDFILIDYNARPHRALLIENYLEGHSLIEWNSQIDVQT